MALLIGEVRGKEIFRRSLSEIKPTVIGRGEEANLRMRIHGISRRHARVEFSDGQWVIRDLGSTNGTLVNSEKISSRVLHEQDRIQLGDVTVRLAVDEQAKEPAWAAALGAAPGESRPSVLRERRKRLARGRESSTAGKIVKWSIRLVVWFALLYCVWGYYDYMTTMKQAMARHNAGIDLYNEGRFGEAITALEEAGTLKKKSRRNLFVRIAYPYLPQRELPIEENTARCYYEMGNNAYNSQTGNRDREALEDFEKAFRLKPDIPALAKTLCQLAFMQKRWHLALDAAEKALRQDPNDTMMEKIRDIARRELSGQ